MPSKVSTNSLAEEMEFLRGQLQGELLTDCLSQGLYSTDASMYQFRPLAVVKPRDRADILQVVNFCNEHKLPLIARGGGTSLTGQSVGEAVILDLSKYCNKILELNVDEQWVRVEPGLVCGELNAYLKSYGLQFAPDPATANRATVGGMIANNASGMRSICYGMTIDHVIELDLALASGEVLKLGQLDEHQLDAKCVTGTREGLIYRKFRELAILNHKEILKRYPKVVRRSGGYSLDAFAQPYPWNMAKVVVGSEGTLGTVLEAKLRLEILPKFSAVCVAHFVTLENCLHAVAPIVAESPSAVELIDGVIIEQARLHPLTKGICKIINGQPAAILIIEVQGDVELEVHKHIEKIADVISKLDLAYALPVMFGVKEIQDVWQMRSSALGLMTTVQGDRKPIPYIEDAAIPPAALPAYVLAVLEVCKRYGQPVSLFGHASVGLLHIRPMHDLHKNADIEQMRQIQEEVFNLVVQYGGSWSGEHGDGIVRGGFNRRFFGDQLYEAFGQIKKLFDPQGLMNPGKIIDTPEMHEHLRFGIDYQPIKVAGLYRYKEWGGLLKAVEQCSGVGACRKTQGGVMCPSYMATLDEEHSTRGRANALRLALTGQLGAEALGSDELYRIFELCLACKGCKGECPNNVDMARLKSEFLYQRQLRRGTTMRARVFGNVAFMAKWLSGKRAPVANAVLANRAVRSLFEHLLGIDQKRILPTYSNERLSEWFARRGEVAKGNGQRVVLFNDTYTEYYQPSIGRAAVEVLEAAGYRVELATVGDSQRSAISQGLLAQAKKQGTAMFQRLLPILRDGAPLLVCEPSCASALSDDLPDLLEDAVLAKSISERVQMVDAFLEQALSTGQCQLPWKISECPPRFLVHGHCHQKAMGSGRHALGLLGRIPGAVVQDTQAGCCGMAGAFGYEKEHAEISHKIASQRLLPKIRAAEADVQIVSNGFSCRSQIEDLGGRRALHVMEAVYRHLATYRQPIKIQRGA